MGGGGGQAVSCIFCGAGGQQKSAGAGLGMTLWDESGQAGQGAADCEIGPKGIADICRLNG